MLGLRAPNQQFQEKPGIFYPNSQFKIFWEILMAIILLFTCFITPINFAFQDELDLIPWWTIFNYCIDFLFFLDILVVFNSALDESMVNYIDDRKQIAIAYLKGWFLIDVLSIFPFEVLLAMLVDEDSTRL